MKFSSKKEQIYAFLRKQIMRGEIAPGERLVIDNLAEDLGISQTPLREVLRMLESDGLVEIAPYVGARVTPLEADSIHEIFSLLTSLEVTSGRLACLRMSNSQMNTLERMIADMEALVNQPDEWSERNKALHAYICECAMVPLMRRMLMMALDHWDRLRSIYLTNVFAGRVAAAQAEHVKLLAALRERDPDRVEEILKKHNAVSLAAYIALLHKTGVLRDTL